MRYAQMGYPPILVRFAWLFVPYGSCWLVTMERYKKKEPPGLPFLGGSSEGVPAFAVKSSTSITDF